MLVWSGIMPLPSFAYSYELFRASVEKEMPKPHPGNLYFKQVLREIVSWQV